MKQDAAAPATHRPGRSVAKGSLLVEVFRIVAPIVIVVGGIIAFVTLKNSKQQPVRAEEQILAPIVETVVVAPHDGGLDIAVDGVVVPFREIDLSAEVSGRIAQKSAICRAGTYVTKGTPLIEIDARDYELEAERRARVNPGRGVAQRVGRGGGQHRVAVQARQRTVGPRAP